MESNWENLPIYEAKFNLNGYTRVVLKGEERVVSTSFDYIRQLPFPGLEIPYCGGLHNALAVASFGSPAMVSELIPIYGIETTDPLELSLLSKSEQALFITFGNSHSGILLRGNKFYVLSPIIIGRCKYQGSDRLIFDILRYCYKERPAGFGIIGGEFELNFVVKERLRKLYERNKPTV